VIPSVTSGSVYETAPPDTASGVPAVFTHSVRTEAFAVLMAFGVRFFRPRGRDSRTAASAVLWQL